MCLIKNIIYNSVSVLLKILSTIVLDAPPENCRLCYDKYNVLSQMISELTKCSTN